MKVILQAAAALLLTLLAPCTRAEGMTVDGYDDKGLPLSASTITFAAPAPKNFNLALTAGGDKASTGPIGRKKIAQWGDPLTPPQLRTRCVSEAKGKYPWGGWWSFCNGWATDTKTMQVEVFVMSIGPETIKAEALDAVQTAVGACVALAATAAGAAIAATPSPEPAARITAGYAAGKLVFAGCLSDKAAALTTASVTASAFDLAFESSSYWSKWSNE